jgi:hypothetical protein
MTGQERRNFNFTQKEKVPPGLASGIRADQRSSKMTPGRMFHLLYTVIDRVEKSRFFVSIAGCADSRQTPL